MADNGSTHPVADLIDLGDLEPVQIPYKIKGEVYILKEASGDAAVKWRNAQFRATKFGPEGKLSSVDGMSDTEPYLVSLCLFKLTTKGNQPVEVPVPAAIIRSWPNKIQKLLFDKVVEISNLKEEETVESIQTEIKELEERTLAKIDELRKKLADAATGLNHEGDPKNSPSAMTAGSV